MRVFFIQMMERKGQIIFISKKIEKKIMVSKFLIFLRSLCILDSRPDHELFQNKDWFLNKNQKSCQYYTKLLKYSKDNYLDRNKMID